MSELNFPNDTSPSPGTVFTGTNNITYVFDGVKWVGQSSAPTGASPTDRITSGTYSVVIDSTGTVTLPSGGTIEDNSSTFGIRIKGSNTEGIQVMSQDTNNYVKVSDSNVHIETDHSGAKNGWDFDLDGTLTTPGHILPDADLSYDLGSTSSQWRSIYVGTGTIYIGGVALGVNQDNYVTVDGNPIVTVNTAGNITIQGDNILTPVYVSDVAPDASVSEGNLWYNTLDGRTYVSYSGQWVDTSPAVVPSPETYLGNITIDGDTLNINGSTLTISNTGTLLVNGEQVISGNNQTIYGATLTASATDPMTSTGTLWFNTIEGRTFLKYNDQWVDVNPTVVPPPETYLGSITIDDSTLNINGGTLTISTSGTLLVNGAPVTGSGGSTWQLSSGTAVMSIDSSGTVTLPSNLQIVDIGPLGGGVFTGTLLLQQGSGILQVVSTGTASAIGWADNALTPNALTTLALSSTGAEITVGNISSGTHVWHFGTDGSTTFPNDTILGTGEDPNVYIETSTTATTSTWTFGTDGVLTLPADTPVIKGGGTGTDVTIIATTGTNTATWVFSATGAVVFPDGTVQTSAYTGGGVKYSSVLDAYAGDYTVNNEQLVLVNNNAISTCTITLPASPTNGQTVTIKKTAAFTSWTVVVDGNGKNIDSSGTLSFNNSYGYVMVAYSTEHAYNQWFIVGGNYATV